jgi:hypothetical protein
MIFIFFVAALVQYLRINVQLAKKKGKIYVHTARGTKEKAVAVSCICSHCLHLAGSRTAQEQQGTVRDVSLTIGNTEFIHVISLSPLISYSQLKMGAERES